MAARDPKVGYGKRKDELNPAKNKIDAAVQPIAVQLMSSKKPGTWTQKSLQELEQNKWPDQKEYPSGLVKRCHEYRKIPVGQLTAEQLRTLIGQQMGLDYLI